MDISPEYILQCEKAEEIQELWEPAEGDWCVEKKYRDIPLVLLTDLRGFGFITGRGWGEDDAFIKDESIFLPTQDQLQELLLTERYEEKYDLCSAFAAYLIDKPDIMSMEQLWLAFCMSERYQKEWRNDEWKVTAEVTVG